MKTWKEFMDTNRWNYRTQVIDRRNWKSFIECVVLNAHTMFIFNPWHRFKKKVKNTLKRNYISFLIGILMFTFLILDFIGNSL